MPHRIVGMVLVGLAVGLSPCSSDDASSRGAARSGGGATAIQGSCDASTLVGLWSGAKYSMKIFVDRTYHASGSPNMASIDVIGTVQVDKCHAKIVDTSGRFACPSANIGRYTFTVSDTTLAFTVVDDPCDGRRIPLTAGPLTKKQAPGLDPLS
jgi:hypothetical protein